MISILKEKRLASMLGWGSVLITIIITDTVSSEPANLGKMLVLSTLGFGIIPLIVKPFREKLASHRFLLFSVALFLLSCLISIFVSRNPFERGFFGAFGRNTGFLSYFLLAIIFLGALSLQSVESFSRIRSSLFLAGFLNLIVCFFAISGNEIFTWNNPSNSIMGTFGNSNFIGAFLGMFSALGFVFLFQNLKNSKLALLALVFLAINLYVINRTNALQGLVVFGLMGYLTIYHALRSHEKLLKVSRVYLFLGIFGGFIGLLGVLNKGLLASILYKPSVTFRWEYWMAGIRMGLDKPFNGVGLDSYGLYYRTFRQESALTFPGPDVTTDAAHNVVIDFFAGTGVIGLVSYLLIMGYVFKCAITYLRNNKSFDPIFLSLFLPWLGYQVQSIVSINQLGLAVWGWLLGGAIISYSKADTIGTFSEESKISSVVKKQKVKRNNHAAQMLPAGTAISIFSMAAVGFLVALPPFVADVNMRTIMSGNSDSAKLISQVKGFPIDANRLNRGVVALANSGLNVLAAELALYGTTRFPNDYASWSSLYELSGPGTQDAEIYRKKLQEIDPFNPKFFDR